MSSQTRMHTYRWTAQKSQTQDRDTRDRERQRQTIKQTVRQSEKDRQIDRQTDRHTEHTDTRMHERKNKHRHRNRQRHRDILRLASRCVYRMTSMRVGSVNCWNHLHAEREDTPTLTHTDGQTITLSVSPVVQHLDMGTFAQATTRRSGAHRM